ncbi:hypothetical protein PC116_g4810 [Phytophthora cactorum]|uniref:Uncharacterized protein n=1 Tax=Phytophthora cactorum TaxID=29920 RepID=A0A8T1LKS9_9STRA|nr:hypothetical protein Pcac1_g19107 [Phytophthora cactorum]KAG2951115.1 hypothetical protein PC117_g3864 [Phytophthora cactorum]KAG3032255.1 hypothetical protein PC120_g2571 [Phytophthora cactorum]KAG3190287.1 hypothetical protein C6341_g1767 [Phytophthora cactorum]KAG3203525.1 hypothetical protein PC128_g2562 [Phytophthora cactorum]
MLAQAAFELELEDFDSKFKPRCGQSHLQLHDSKFVAVRQGTQTEHSARLSGEGGPWWRR